MSMLTENNPNNTEQTVIEEGSSLDACQRELAEQRERYARLSADFENAKKRMWREQQLAEQRMREQLFKGVLAVADNIDRALDQTASANGDQLRLGLELIQKEMRAYLASNGIVLMQVGDVFNPEQHEAIASVPAVGKSAGSIVQVVRAGYLYNNQILRPAQVLVAQE